MFLYLSVCKYIHLANGAQSTQLNLLPKSWIVGLGLGFGLDLVCSNYKRLTLTTKEVSWKPPVRCDMARCDMCVCLEQ